MTVPRMVLLKGGALPLMSLKKTKSGEYVTIKILNWPASQTWLFQKPYIECNVKYDFAQGGKGGASRC